MATQRVRMPNGLGYQGKKLWQEVTGVYDLSVDPHKRRILYDACKTADLIDTLDKAMTGQSLTVRGSMGQQVINPLVAQAQSGRVMLAQLLARLNLAEAGEDDETY
ncbi:hypothetical protein PP452_08770 [Mycobacteroides abscessus]|nr:hypothetical protein [Mycobacteroides abscessus]MDM2250783.1 hypothetical protein [Mycobacteroides abscessus]